MQFLVSLVGRVSVVGPLQKTESDLIEGHLDEVMDELLKLDATDPGIDLDFTRNEATLSVLVEASNPLEATNVANGLIRTAIHAAGGSTPDWPVPPDGAWSVVLVSLRSDPAETTESLGELVGA